MTQIQLTGYITLDEDQNRETDDVIFQVTELKNHTENIIPKEEDYEDDIEDYEEKKIKICLEKENINDIALELIGAPSDEEPNKYFDFVIQSKEQRLKKRNEYYDKQTKPPAKKNLDVLLYKNQSEKLKNQEGLYPYDDSDDNNYTYIYFQNENEYSSVDLEKKVCFSEFSFYDMFDRNNKEKLNLSQFILPNNLSEETNTMLENSPKEKIELVLLLNKLCIEECNPIEFFNKSNLDKARENVKKFKVKYLEQKINNLNSMNIEQRETFKSQYNLTEENFTLLENKMMSELYRKKLSILTDFYKYPSKDIIESATYQKDYYEIKELKYKLSLANSNSDNIDLMKEVIKIRETDLKNNIIAYQIDNEESIRENNEISAYFFKYYVMEIDEKNRTLTLCLVQHYDIVKVIKKFNFDQFSKEDLESIISHNNPNIYHNYIHNNFDYKKLAKLAVENYKNILPESYLNDILNEFLILNNVQEIPQNIVKLDDKLNYVTFDLNVNNDIYTFSFKNNEDLSFRFKSVIFGILPKNVIEFTTFKHFINNSIIDEGESTIFNRHINVDNFSKKHINMIKEFCDFTSSIPIKNKINDLIFNMCKKYSETFNSNSLHQYMQTFSKTLKSLINIDDKDILEQVFFNMKTKISYTSNLCADDSKNKLPKENTKRIYELCIDFLKDNTETLIELEDYMITLKRNNILNEKYFKIPLSKRRQTIVEIKEAKVFVTQRYHKKFDNMYRKPEMIRDLGVLMNFASIFDISELRKYTSKMISYYIIYYEDITHDYKKLHDLFGFPEIDLEMRKKIYNSNPWMTLWKDEPGELC